MPRSKDDVLGGGGGGLLGFLAVAVGSTTATYLVVWLAGWLWLGWGKRGLDGFPTGNGKTCFSSLPAAAAVAVAAAAGYTHKRRARLGAARKWA